MNQKKQQLSNSSQDKVCEIKKKIHKPISQQSLYFWGNNYIESLKKSFLTKNFMYLNLLQFPQLKPTNLKVLKEQTPKNLFDDIPILIGVDEITESEQIYYKQSRVCSICLLEINEKILIKILQCNHYFHNDCIKEWILRKPECPTCRENILSQ
ncbi:unnamed protein product (macronuclear) [Paramecium tetraurelia]|uniref:RING-type domain-containing protein n=1 Tax=Paramecium tetraurelia TaxID=5888 RepID=A0CCU3_PARTE|nr:uncharacterized protein GSPATT00037395001 [Paramecium tetraurelia]CAK68610.1 unnamed protein product [Paramecium tetraurelia]|eukprot:XP_001436007.1 hypothetical protein (macronuclear) [Paramecium tetraurelia strain d4-2]